MLFGKKFIAGLADIEIAVFIFVPMRTIQSEGFSAIITDSCRRIYLLFYKIMLVQARSFSARWFAAFTAK